jgi:ferritin-like metal-binding protein YciE
MPDDLSTRDAKLIQYLNEAYGKEKELETALAAHVKMAKRPPYKKRLQDHLKETKAQSKGLEKRIKALGGKAERTPVAVPGPAAAAEAAAAVTAAATKAVAASKGPIHALRGTGEAEKQLKNAKTELWNEYEEIGNYQAIEALAEALNDTETAKLAREYRRQEERMAGYLLKLIPTLTKAVVTEEIPAAERRAAAAATGSRARRASGSSRSASGSSRSGGTRTAATGSTAATAAKRSSAGTGKRSSSGGAKRSSGTAAKRSTGAAATPSAATATKRSGGARSRAARSSSA